MSKRRQTTKARAFWATFWALIGLYALTAAIAADSLGAVGPAIVAALAFAGFGYQAANVADNWQRSANYRPELDKGEECVGEK